MEDDKNKPEQQPAAAATPSGSAAAGAAQPELSAKAAKKKADKAAKNEAFQKKQEEKKKREEDLKKKQEEKAKKALEASADGQPVEEEKKAKKDKADKGPRIQTAYENKTPKGEKKALGEMANAYDPPAVEAAWYDWWVAQGFFKPSTTSTDNFVIVIPPPNVTGSLHLGHALTNSVQDALVRWNRMKGKRVLWVPGTDHAGIATQSVVERKLLNTKGITRHDLGREAFIKEVWEWKNESGDRILFQLRRLGSSLDWDREVFTMDAVRSEAVTEAFVRLWDKGMIFRDERIINWCCQLRTALSDEEVDKREINEPTMIAVPGHNGKEYEFGIIVNFAYPLEGGGEIIVGTTRPETMLGDTAIAVHPADDRYTKLHGKFAIHPFDGRKIPIVCDDELVKMEFGTGAVKVTPAHDQDDFKCGVRNKLKFINIFHDDGTINENGGTFKGMKRFDARNAVLEQLKAKGLYRETKANPMVLGICSRSGDVIEPIIKPQWFVKKDLATPAAQAVRDKQLEIIPHSQQDAWFRWLDTPRDWCISRQLWWGHRVPAWLVTIEGMPAPNPSSGDSWIAARSEQEALEKAAKKHGIEASKIKLSQDGDVLDTWFSSSLFPFSVFGWPKETKDMEDFYPTTVLETGLDILTFWVSKMVMMGLALTGKLPFKKVLLHAMVRDAFGKKMSKSKGNVIDPVDVIEGITFEALKDKLKTYNLSAKELEAGEKGLVKSYPNGISECGTDATRFVFCAYTSQGSNINLDINRAVVYRNFCNKLWNCTKFAFFKFGENFVPNPTDELTGDEGSIEKWILSRLSNAVIQSNAGLETFELAQSADALYRFFWEELCDVFLEAIKPLFNSGNEKRIKAVQNTLYTCLEVGFRALHPFMPFITEELWQRLPKRAANKAPSLCIAPYPTRETIPGKWSNKILESQMRTALDLVHEYRSMRTAYSLLPKNQPELYIKSDDEETQVIANELKDVIITLVNAGSLRVLEANEAVPTGCAVYIVNEHVEIYMLLKGLVDPAAEIEKLQKQEAKLEEELKALLKRMNGPQYEQKVPPAVQEQNKQQVAAIQKEIQRRKDTIHNFSQLLKST